MLTAVVDGTYGFGALGQQPVYMPDYAWPSATGPSTVLVSLPPAQLPSNFPATFAGPRFTPSPVPTLSWRKCLSYLRSRHIAYRLGQPPHTPQPRTLTVATIRLACTTNHSQHKNCAASGPIRLPPEPRPSPPPPIHGLPAT